jgi:DNA-directed RNA polymerase specialized sigma24 family protein
MQIVCSLEAVLTPESAKAMLRVIGLETGSPVYDEDLAQEALLRGLIAFGRSEYVSNPQAFFAKIQDRQRHSL